MTSDGWRLGKLWNILTACVKAAWLCHCPVSCSEHPKLVMLVRTTNKMDFLGHRLLPSKEMIMELPLPSYCPLLIRSTFVSVFAVA